MGGAAWSSYDLDELDVRELGDDAATVTYGAVARREGADDYSALMASTYVRRPAGWRLVLHQLTDNLNANAIVAAGVDLFVPVVAGRRFAVRARRVGSHPFSSKDVEIALGAALVALLAGVALACGATGAAAGGQPASQLYPPPFSQFDPSDGSPFVGFAGGRLFIKKE